MRRNLRLSGGRQKTSSEYLLADGAMGVFKMPTSQLDICWLHFLIWSTPNSQSSLRLPQLPSLWWPPSCPLSLFLAWPRRTTHTEHRFFGIGYWAFIARDDLIFIQTFFSLLPSTLPTWWPPQWQLTYSCRSSTGCAPLASISKLDL